MKPPSFQTWARKEVNGKNTNDSLDHRDTVMLSLMENELFKSCYGVQRKIISVRLSSGTIRACAY
jgi:hypothetical protein